MKKIVTTIIVIVFSIMIGKVVLAKSGRVTTNNLNVRDGSTTSANSIGKLEKNKTISILDEEDGWYKIDYDGKDAYVSKNYVEEIDATSDNQENEVGTSSNTDDSSKENKSTIKELSKLSKEADLYILPLLNATKVNKLEEGKEFSVILDYGKWLYIEIESEKGWIISQDIELIEKEQEEVNDEQNEIESETTNTVESESNNDNNENKETESGEYSSYSDEDSNDYPKTMYVDADSVNVRSSASTSSRAIAGVTRNESVKVIAKEGDWYKVDTEDGIGYIKSNLLSDTKN
ncbi:MAG: SH3 domain-containing protein [Clostridia bacterium]|nr:SH3 domain-containing protein [Clostridia bacterium]